MGGNIPVACELWCSAPMERLQIDERVDLESNTNRRTLLGAEWNSLGFTISTNADHLAEWQLQSRRMFR